MQAACIPREPIRVFAIITVRDENSDWSKANMVQCYQCHVVDTEEGQNSAIETHHHGLWQHP